MSVAAISIDAPEHSLALIERLGISFGLGSDPGQRVVQQFGVQNPDTKELALHAVYIVDTEGVVFYRKVALRRPTSEELIDAIDGHRGTYAVDPMDPADDTRAPRPKRVVAYPSNNFQALLEISAIKSQPPGFDAVATAEVLELLQRRKLDDAMIAFQQLTARTDRPLEAMLGLATWITRATIVGDKPRAVNAGKNLAKRLARVSELEVALSEASDADKKGEVLQTLAKARGGLSLARGTVSSNQGEWQLDFAQALLRSYREVAKAAFRAR